MTDSTQNLDPDTFDVSEWMGNDDPDAYRNRTTVEVYVVRPGLREELDKLGAEHDRYTAQLESLKATKGERSIADAGPAAVKTKLADVEARMEKAIERVGGARRELEVVGLITPEIQAAVQSVESSDDYDRTIALLAAACRVNGQHLSQDGLRRLHPAIGQSQWQKLVEAYNQVTHGDRWAVVGLPFSLTSSPDHSQR